MPKQDGNIKIVESFITSNKPMSLNNKNIYYNEYSDEVLIRYYQTLIAVRKDKSVRILEGINKYSASTSVLVRLIERIAKEKGCTVTYVKQFAKGSNVVGVNKYKIKNLNSFDKFYDEIGYTQKELSLPKQDENKNWYTVTNDKSIAEILINEGFVEKYAKGSTVKGDIVYTNKEVYDNGEVVDSWASDIGGSNESQDNIVEYKGDKYLVSINVEDNEVIRPKAKALIYEQEYAKGSTLKGKDFSGNYYSTNDFVGAHNLQKQAEKILGKGWEAEDDVNQIESIINSLGGKYVVTVPEDRSQWNEMREQYDLAKPTNDSNYDISVISESDFKYGNGGGVAVSSESGLAVGTNADLMMNQNNLQYAEGGGLWKMNDVSKAKYLGILEFQDNEGEYHNFEVMETEDRLVFGGFTNSGFIESGYIDKDGFSTDETLQELLADLEVYYNDGKEYTSMIVVNERMAKGGIMSSGFNYEIGGL